MLWSLAPFHTLVLKSLAYAPAGSWQAQTAPSASSLSVVVASSPRFVPHS